MSDLPCDVILLGDSREVLKTLPDASVNSVVTDPPAGISFMGKDWDNPDELHDGDHKDRAAFVAFLTGIMAECLRVLKPGGHILVWSIPRTSHWTATAIEDAGFEIRDCIHHIFGQGFPKSLNIGKAIDKMAGAEREVVGVTKITGRGGDAFGYGPAADQTRFKAGDIPITAPATDDAKKWDGWGTQLKPAVETWWLARKPIEATNVAAQVLATGTGGLNIDGARISSTQGWGMTKTGSEYEDVGGASQFFQTFEPTYDVPFIYTGKASKADKNADLDRMPKQTVSTPGNHKCLGCNRVKFGQPPCECADPQWVEDMGPTSSNFHPTVKSQALMTYLVRLVTPRGGIVLDPFAGSGSTCVAAVTEGMHFIGIEREADYHLIAKTRTDAILDREGGSGGQHDLHDMIFDLPQE